MNWIFLFITLVTFANQKTPLLVCGKKINVEIVQTEEEKRKGLMDRDRLPKNQGMLFVYDKEEVMSFWMKNTRIPLSIGFFDKNKKLIDMQDMKPLDTSLTYVSKKPAQFALEVNQGWFRENGIKLGCEFEYNF